MKTIKIITVLLLFLLLTSAVFGQRHMIHTYWHELDGPYWIYKPAGISIASDYIYSFGSDKAATYTVFRSDDNGNSWLIRDRSTEPANSISVCKDPGYGGHAYYTSLENDVYSTFNGGADWQASTIPPENSNFTGCAASPHNNQRALVGCSLDGSNATIWKTENHGGNWTSVEDYDDYAINDIEWMPDSGLPDDFLIAVSGAPIDACFFRYNSNLNQFEDMIGLELGVSEIACFDVVHTDQTYILAAAIQNGQWQIIKNNGLSPAWHDEIVMPAELTADNVIRDISITYVQAYVSFYIATDIGVFKYTDQTQWTHVYDNDADNNVFSVASISETEVYAGTLHRFVKVAEEYSVWTAQPEKDVMLKADLKSVWTNSSSSQNNYTLNYKTGAIFNLNLDFSLFDPIDPTIGLSQDDIVANISGIDGEFDGLAIAGYGSNVIASSKDDLGEGKLIRYNDTDWAEVAITGNPPFEAMGMDADNSYAISGNTPANFYKGNSVGEAWQLPPLELEMDIVNSISIVDLGSGNFMLLLAGKPNGQNNHKIAYSTDSGDSWSFSDGGLGSVNEVYRVEGLKDASGNSFSYYAATDDGIYKTNDLNVSWTRKDNQLPPGANDITDILVESGEYTLDPSPPSDNYVDGFVVQAVMDNGAADRFFISADSARSWNEDSSFPEDVDIRRLRNYDYNSYGQQQTGIVAATNKGLLYHPHNVINGMYVGNGLSPYLEYYWGPGLILVNGDVIIRPKLVEGNPDPIALHARLNISPVTSVKFTYIFDLGTTNLSGIVVNDALTADGLDENNLSVFTSSRTTGYGGDWRGIISEYFKDESIPPYSIITFPSTGLNYCLVENGVNGLSSQSSMSFGVGNSIIRKNQQNGVYCANLQEPPEGLLFRIGVDSCTIYDNPDNGIYLVGTADWVDCSKPWDPKDPLINPDTIWNPKYPPKPKKPPELPCDYIYWTWAFVDNNQIFNSNDGIVANGVLLLYATFNTIYWVDHYGIQQNNGVASWLWMNAIRSGREDLIKYSGISLNNPFFILAERNEIAECTKAGFESNGRGFIFILGNYVHDNEFSNVYVMNSYPLIKAWIGAVPEEYPNSLIGSETGCYVIRTDFGPINYAQPVIFNNRIKGYSKSGIYVVNSAWPILGIDERGGGNSIAEGLQGSWNFIWDVYLPPLDPILAIGNWWGSNDPHDFRFIGNLDYSHWLDDDPYDGMLPKAGVRNDIVPKRLSISSAYPNPFNSNVMFEFSMPDAGEAQGAVFDLLGRKVKTIVDRHFTAGTHTIVWNGENESGRVVGSGIYFFRLESGNKLAVEKVTLLK
ncbi:MAG: T9SS type A sorting domain-containing protein [candidate division Zixibacteria bacterium]